MLINMDDNMRGRVLTAHGAGEEWDKTCGLGQGSVLAPLKWNLFLDPLLHLMEDTSDPYIMGSGPSAIHLRILAFADDTTIFASSHRGYIERMELAGKYFGIFGVNFSPSKTHYTYANTQGRHYRSAPITVRKPDGTTSIQPSSVTSPHKPLRYLGAWLSPTLNWLPAKRKLRDEVSKILTILNHKKLSPAEFKYTVQSVLHSKLRYYLAVVPMLDTELDDIDARIARIMKKRMRMASSCSSPLLFMPDSEYGAELPSIKDTRSTMSIEMAHSLLNDDRSTLGAIIRHRLTDLRDSLGWAQNPLSTPHLIPQSHWNTHWCARIGIMLHRHSATISDTHGRITRPGKRYSDKSLHTMFTRTAFASARETLKKHGIYWLGQITNPFGTKLSTRTDTGVHKDSKWWKLLRTNVSDENNILHKPISPIASPIKHFTPTHNPGTIATTFTKDTPNGEWEHRYYKITDSHIGYDGRETCYVTQLHECSSKLRTIRVHQSESTQSRGDSHITTKSSYKDRRVSRTRGKPYFKGDNHTVEFADALYPLQCTWVHATPYGRHSLDVGIIHDSCSIHTSHLSYHGNTTNVQLAAYADDMRGRFCPQTGEYNPPPTQQNVKCILCTHDNADLACSSKTCTHHAHSRCTDQQRRWTCSACTVDTKHVHPLHPSQLRNLERSALLRTIYSSSDGSVTNANTTRASSSFGMVIDPSHTNITRRGRISIRMGEESSLRVELEALIHAYTLIPAHISTIHAVDNETAIDIHTTLNRSGLPSQRELMKLAYHSTIVRLHAAMQSRGTSLTVVHTLSHLEHQHTSDPDLAARRHALAKADSQADLGHKNRYAISDDSGIEAFALHINGILVEKGAKTPFASIQMAARKKLLYARYMEGANHRVGKNPGWSTGGRQWPSFLRVFRHKLVTQRLPTAKNRAFRGDTENGTVVNPWCPHCLALGDCNIETHIHFLTCPCTKRSRLQLQRAVNNECRRMYQPKHINTLYEAETESTVMSHSGIPWTATEGWKSYTEDKHGRKSTIATGQPGRSYEFGNRLTAWSHNIMQHCRAHVPQQDHFKYLQAIRPYTSLDPHLLQGLAQAIQATSIHDTIPHNPFIPTPTHCITKPSMGQLPTVINGVGNDFDWEKITEPLTHTRPWVMLLDQEHTEKAKTLDTEPLTTIPEHSISTWGYSFWAGTSGLFPETNEATITVYVSKQVTPLQRQCILDTIYMRSTQAGHFQNTLLLKHNS